MIIDCQTFLNGEPIVEEPMDGKTMEEKVLYYRKKRQQERDALEKNLNEYKKTYKHEMQLSALDNIFKTSVFDDEDEEEEEKNAKSMYVDLKLGRYNNKECVHCPFELIEQTKNCLTFEQKSCDICKTENYYNYLYFNYHQ